MSVHEDVNQVNRTAWQTTVIDIDDNSSTDYGNLLTCALYLQKKNSDRDWGYADTEGQYQCLHDYHYNCLREMHNDCWRTKTNMKWCHQCRKQFFGILDCERVNRCATMGDTANCPICQCRLNTHNELGRMITGPPTNGCQCTAKYHYSCLLHYKNDQQSQHPTQEGVRCMMCECISEGICRIWW